MADIFNFEDYYVAPNFDFNMPTKSSRALAVKQKPSSPEQQGSLDNLCGVCLLC